MDLRARPPAVVVVLAWVFGISAGLTLLATPAFIVAGWATRILLARLAGEGLVYPDWYPPLLASLFVVLVLLNTAVGLTSLIGARAFLRLRRWAWRWFDGLLVTSLIGLAGMVVVGLVVGGIVFSRLTAEGGAPLASVSPLGVSGFAGLAVGLAVVNGMPLAVMLWLLRSRYVRPLFGADPGRSAGSAQAKRRPSI